MEQSGQPSPSPPPPARPAYRPGSATPTGSASTSRQPSNGKPPSQRPATAPGSPPAPPACAPGTRPPPDHRLARRTRQAPRRRPPLARPATRHAQRQGPRNPYRRTDPPQPATSRPGQPCRIQQPDTASPRRRTRGRPRSRAHQPAPHDPRRKPARHRQHRFRRRAQIPTKAPSAARPGDLHSWNCPHADDSAVTTVKS
jgi:hypothetical protein